MKFNYASIGSCHTASGLVIVSDVLRAFSHGAKEIILAGTVEQALGLKTHFPKSDPDDCTRFNAFDFAMPITRNNDQLSMQAVKP